MDEPCINESRRSDRALLSLYRLGKTLGFGSFGKVKLAHHVLTGHKVAIKILNRQMLNDSEIERVTREIKILRLFAHPHIIRLYEFIETRSNIYVVTEYINRGELFYYILEKGKVLEDEARYFFQQIISGVEFCHLNMVVHRDLKPENLLLDSEHNLKIADFGLSNVMRDGHFLKTSCGSPNYAAPEVLSGELYAGPEVDVWSCGVILYALLCGRLPFDVDNLPNLFKLIRSGIYTLPSHLSPGARDLIHRMLVVDPMKRIKIHEIRRHPWFIDHLPRYLALPAMQIAKQIDEEILQHVIEIGFDRNKVIESLQNRIQNEATVTYYLLWDNQFRISSSYLRAEFQEASDTYSSTSSITNHTLQQQGFTAGRKWLLGLQSQAPPIEIMTEVLRALQTLNVFWKKIGHYTMKCRWLPSFHSHSGTALSIPLHTNHTSVDDRAIVGDGGTGVLSHNAVKFEMQLYKAKGERYLLDLQMVHGSPLHFLEICAAFLTKLQVI
ncbi:SNF1-related protein kinase catalytic subunit alpha KIN10-like isoform X2 [Tasmannia lanceolata]|uniref:SNF1-related protein kinase catalytic subunit alpha KIN10-like isoform X2 n=1 Tax=Tasmannia lanceolata TaxID=3420 RepID=UPI0040649239